MLPIRRWATVLLVMAPLAACGNPDPTPYEVPPGVSVDPPRRAAETGGVSPTGQEPMAPAQAGGQAETLDTVGAPVVGPNN